MSTVNAGHIPVLLAEVVETMGAKDGGRYLDGTLGLGGHARGILASATCELLGLDRDPEALRLARENLQEFGGRVHTEQACYADFSAVMDRLGWDTVDGALLDIGVSSLQLDKGERGFSFRTDAPLDMRMDQQASFPTARDIVNSADPAVLRECLITYGEEPNAERIVRKILEARAQKTIETTGELARIVAQAYPRAWRASSRHHPATKTFQALRILVNDELGQLQAFLDRILGRLRGGGRLLIITFHSLEDRLVKQTMQKWSRDCICPPLVDTCLCHHTKEVRILFKKPLTATARELERNPRAGSAKLRAVEKLP